jgi:hypothetical protein
MLDKKRRKSVKDGAEGRLLLRSRLEDRAEPSDFFLAVVLCNEEEECFRLFGENTSSDSDFVLVRSTFSDGSA